MQMSGEQRIAASRQRVWDALNDPEVLRQCIPGCQALERDGADRFTALAEVRIGPIGARFKGQVQLSDMDAPNGYTITGSGNGGIAGSAKGGAKVRLSDAPGGGTLVSYDVEAEVGGRMAQLGGPIVDATAKNLAGKFFAKFGEVVGGAQAENAAAPAKVTPAPAPETLGAVQAVAAAPGRICGGIWGWVAAVVVAILAGYILGLQGAGAGMIALVLVLLVMTAAAAFETGRRGAGR